MAFSLSLHGSDLSSLSSSEEFDSENSWDDEDDEEIGNIPTGKCDVISNIELCLSDDEEIEQLIKKVREKNKPYSASNGRKAQKIHLKSDINKMKMQVVSDLHLESYENYQQIPEDTIIPSAPILALLGDIAYSQSDVLRDFLRFQSSRFELVIFLAGNHEFHSEDGDPVEDKLEWMRHIASESENIIFLEKDALEINNVIILGTTLWSYIPEYAKIDAQYCVSDYQHIFMKQDNQIKSINPEITNNWFLKNASWLQEQIEKAENEKKHVIVLSHHAPVAIKTSHPRFIRSPIKSCFSTDLKRLLSSPSIKIWACGHTHYNFDFIISGTRVLSNQKGPGDPIKGFRSSGILIDFNSDIYYVN